MAGQSDGAPEPVADNDNDYDLIDRLRGAALAGTSDAKSRRSAQLAFDPTIDIEKRMRVIAGLAGEDRPNKPRSKEKGRWSWLPIPLGILTVMTLGAAVAKRAPAPKTQSVQIASEEEEAEMKAQAAANTHSPSAKSQESSTQVSVTPQ